MDDATCTTHSRSSGVQTEPMQRMAGTLGSSNGASYHVWTRGGRVVSLRRRINAFINKFLQMDDRKCGNRFFPFATIRLLIEMHREEEGEVEFQLARWTKKLGHRHLAGTSNKQISADPAVSEIVSMERAFGLCNTLVDTSWVYLSFLLKTYRKVYSMTEQMKRNVFSWLVCRHWWIVRWWWPIKNWFLSGTDVGTHPSRFLFFLSDTHTHTYTQRGLFCESCPFDWTIEFVQQVLRPEMLQHLDFIICLVEVQKWWGWTLEWWSTKSIQMCCPFKSSK